MSHSVAFSFLTGYGHSRISNIHNQPRSKDRAKEEQRVRTCVEYFLISFVAAKRVHFSPLKQSNVSISASEIGSLLF